MKKFIVLSLVAAIAAVALIGEADASHTQVMDLAFRIFPGLAS